MRVCTCVPVCSPKKMQQEIAMADIDGSQGNVQLQVVASCCHWAHLSQGKASWEARWGGGGWGVRWRGASLLLEITMTMMMMIVHRAAAKLGQAAQPRLALVV